MIPGFAERLEQELRKLAPPTVTVEVGKSAYVPVLNDFRLPVQVTEQLHVLH